MPSRPRRIVLATFGSHGDLNPFVGLARGLAARGHHAVVATSPCYRAAVERAGVGFHAVRPDGDPTDRALVARIMDGRRGTEFLVRDYLLPRLRESADDLAQALPGTDLLISHPITWAAPLLAEARGLPWASVVLAPISLFSAHDLPVFPEAGWVKHLEALPGVSRALVGLVKGVTRPWMEPVRQLRRELGLPPGGHALFDGQHSPHLVLALFSPMMAAPQPDWPKRVRVTGAVPYNGPADEPLSPELEAFLQAGPPPLVFTLGSSAVAAAGPFYERSAAATRALGMRAVLLTGSHEENRLRITPGDDILVVDHAAHARLLPRAAATVHQGGIGTLHQALRAGVPMLVVPFAHDQPDNAHRAEQLGVAHVVTPRRYTVTRATRELGRLLGDPGYARRAREVGARVAAEDGVAAAVDAIEGLLATLP
jgi:UDP:flavonoid glycosyltransferase YjiC (YdhE family)